MNDAAQDAPRVLSVPEAGRKYLGLTRSAAYRAAQLGAIPTIRIGRRMVVPIAAMERLVNGDEVRNA